MRVLQFVKTKLINFVAKHLENYYCFIISLFKSVISTHSEPFYVIYYTIWF